MKRRGTERLYAETLRTYRPGAMLETSDRGDLAVLEPAMTAVLGAVDPPPIVGPRLDRGTGARVHRVGAGGGRWVLKVHAEPRRYRQERDAYRNWLQDEPACAALVASDDETRALLLMDLEGARTERPDLRAAGAFLRRLHGRAPGPPDPVPLRDALLRRFDRWGAAAGLPAARTAALRRAVERASWGEQRVPCHRDFTPDNWLETPQGWAVVDFEHARIDHPSADLVRLLPTLAPAQADAFWEGLGHRPDEREWACIQAMTGLHAVATRAWARRHDDLAGVASADELLRGLDESHK